MSLDTEAEHFRLHMEAKKELGPDHFDEVAAVHGPVHAKDTPLGRIVAKNALLGRAVEMLRKIQFKGVIRPRSPGDEWEGDVCPACQGDKDCGHFTAGGVIEDCALAKILSDAEALK